MSRIQTGTVRISTFSWGLLRVIESRNDFKVVIHPEEADGIRALTEDGQEFVFTDEQGIEWTTRLSKKFFGIDDQLTFENDRKSVKVLFSSLFAARA